MRRPLRIALAVLALPVLVLVGAFLYGAVLGLTGRWEPAPGTRGQTRAPSAPHETR